MAVLTTGIRHLVRVLPSLLNAGNHLTTDRAVRIFSVDEVEIVRRDGHCQLVAGKQDPRAFFRAEREMLLKLRQGGHPVLELPRGVVPLMKRNLGTLPIAGGVGTKGFFGQGLLDGH